MIRRSNWRMVLSAWVLAAALIATGCGNHPEVITANERATAQAKNAGNFTRTYFIGDSLTAGFQNGSLLDTQQVNGYAALIAKQAAFPITLPLIAPPGAPPLLQLVSPGPPPVIVPSQGQTPGRDNPTQQATDLAVPGALTIDAISTRPSATPTTPQAQITSLVLGIPALALNISRSQLEWAENLDPTTVFVWIGNNDVLVADSTGMPSSMTPVATFTTQFTQLIQGLQQNTNAHLVIANIPDVTSIPYLTPAPLVVAEFSAATGLPTTTLSALFGITTGDLVNPTGLAEAQNILAGKQKGPIDDAGVLTAAEAATVRSTVTQYNQAIASVAQQAGATLIDVNTFFSGVNNGKFVVNGKPLTNQFLGGAFGLDGIHPSNTGYALLANFFIDNMNAAFKTTVPDIDVNAVASTDPYGPHAQVANAHISVQAGRQVDPLLRH
jgi:lysophospholipase L1-like esterase